MGDRGGSSPFTRMKGLNKGFLENSSEETQGSFLDYISKNDRKELTERSIHTKIKRDTNMGAVPVIKCQEDYICPEKIGEL